MFDHRHAADRQVAGQRRGGGFAALGQQVEHPPPGGVGQRGEDLHQAVTRSA
jgi:hypothetical protein